MNAITTSYGRAILAGFEYLLSSYPEVFVIGQGLWSPWYVGSSMTDLEKKFGTGRVIDSPVSEAAVTGVAVGASLCGYRPVAIHPRIDFLILAVDQIVNQAAKWTHMFGGRANVPVTIRGIINRGGEQGAQHSQSLHSWFAHVPGLRVVMPATPQDARDLLIASVLCDDPVLYIDDRWLYEDEAVLPEISESDIARQRPQILRAGSDCTLVACSYSTRLCLDAASALAAAGTSCEVIDLRVIAPIDYGTIAESVARTGRLLAVDGGWSSCGLAAEIIAGVAERIDPAQMASSPARLTIADAPAPTSKPLEAAYYPGVDDVVAAVKMLTASS